MVELLNSFVLPNDMSEVEVYNELGYTEADIIATKEVLQELGLDETYINRSGTVIYIDNGIAAIKLENYEICLIPKEFLTEHNTYIEDGISDEYVAAMNKLNN